MADAGTNGNQSGSATNDSPSSRIDNVIQQLGVEQDVRRLRAKIRRSTSIAEDDKRYERLSGKSHNTVRRETDEMIDLIKNQEQRQREESCEEAGGDNRRKKATDGNNQTVHSKEERPTRK